MLNFVGFTLMIQAQPKIFEYRHILSPGHVTQKLT